MPEPVTSTTNAQTGTAAPTAATSAPADLLGCGHPVASLVDQADAGRLEPADAHQVNCEHCRSALRAAAVSRQALELLRAARGPVPAGLVDRVLREVRSRRDRDRLIELGPSGGSLPGLLSVAGGVRVHPQVVADLARAAAAAVRGVTVARAGATGRSGQAGVDVTLGLLVDGRTPLPELARVVRRAVQAAVRRATGVEQVQVTLTALDLLPEP